MCPRCFGSYEGRLSPGRTVLSASSPDRPRPAAPPCAATRPARGMFGFRIRQIQIVEPKTRTYHRRVGMGRRTAGRRGGAETGKTGRRWVGSPKKQPTLLPRRRSKKTFLGAPVEARTKETLCTPTGEQNLRLTRDLSAVNAGRRPHFVPGC